MAPRKPAVTGRTAKRSTTSESKVVKRPTRGYHRYKNGQLNVTPKGNEKELVKSNQKSPLLRLPPEIRTRIWEYTLGYAVFTARSKWHYPRSVRFTPLSDQSGIGVSILRTCRQIYAEAALMPIRLNTFAFPSALAFQAATKRLNPYQRKQITTIRLELEKWMPWKVPGPWIEPTFSSTYPAVKAFQLVVFNMQEHVITVRDIEVHTRKKHGRSLEDTGISLTVEGVDDAMPVRRYCKWF